MIQCGLEGWLPGNYSASSLSLWNRRNEQAFGLKNHYQIHKLLHET